MSLSNQRSTKDLYKGIVRESIYGFLRVKPLEQALNVVYRVKYLIKLEALSGDEEDFVFFCPDVADQMGR